MNINTIIIKQIDKYKKIRKASVSFLNINISYLMFYLLGTDTINTAETEISHPMHANLQHLSLRGLL